MNQCVASVRSQTLAGRASQRVRRPPDRRYGATKWTWCYAQTGGESIVDECTVSRAFQRVLPDHCGVSKSASNQRDRSPQVVHASTKLLLPCMVSIDHKRLLITGGVSSSLPGTAVDGRKWIHDRRSTSAWPRPRESHRGAHSVSKYVAWIL